MHTDTSVSYIQNRVFVIVIIIIITQRFHLVNGLLSFHGRTSSRIVVGDRDDRFALDILNRVFPCVPVILVLDEESNQHTGVYFTNVQSAQPPSVAGPNLRDCVLSNVFVEGQCRSREVGVEVKQVGTRLGAISCPLCSNEVM